MAVKKTDEIGVTCTISTEAPELPATVERPGSAAESKAADYSKAQLLASGRYARIRDALTVVLEDGKRYTFDEIERITDKFLGKKEAR